MDIVESLFTLQIVYQICSLSPLVVKRKTWTLQRSRFLEIFTFLVILVATAFLLFGIFGDDDLIKSNTDDIGQTVDLIQLVGTRLAHLVSITESLLRRKDQKIFYDMLKEIDGIFERSLNVDLNNGKFRRLTLQYFLLLFSTCVACEVFILATHLIWSENNNFFSYWIFYMMPLLICGFRYFQMFTAMHIVKRRFDKLIQIINDINLEKPPEKYLQPLNSMTPFYTLLEFSLQKGYQRQYDVESAQLKKLLIIRQLYNRLYALTEIYNRYFGVSILANVGNDFISITSNCYWIFINFSNFGSTTKDFLQILVSAVWSLPHLLNVLILAILCEKTVKSATGIALGLHRISIDTLNDNHNSVIQQFSLQLLHQKISITAAGFFSIDCTLLYTIVAATTTYLIILIQFHLNEG